jgi:hypothetical protein
MIGKKDPIFDINVSPHGGVSFPALNLT